MPSTFNPSDSPRSDVRHHRGTRRNGAATQVVTVGKAARQDHEIDLWQIAFRMPHHERLPARRQPQGPDHVMLAIDAGEDYDGGLHASSIW